MSTLDAMRRLLAKPKELGMAKIGHRYIYPVSDGRERITLVVRVIKPKRLAS